MVLYADYRHARVHYALRESAAGAALRKPPVERAFARATPFFRARIAEAIEIKRIADLRFVFDAAAAPPESNP